MGYTTEFYGELTFNKPISKELKTYINEFSMRRHMIRDINIIKRMDPDWKQHCFNGDLGKEGCYYIVPLEIPQTWVENTRWSIKNENGLILNSFGQERDISVIDNNSSPSTCPGLWCQWKISDNDTLCWDGGEKFYNYVEWLTYLIKNFFEPLGYKLSGIINWQGEYSDDTGSIKVIDNDIYVYDL